jgi:hypothetical protein
MPVYTREAAGVSRGKEEEGHQVMFYPEDEDSSAWAALIRSRRPVLSTFLSFKQRISGAI